MNYIPGFSNYLRTSVPRYARGGPARFVEDVMYDMGDYGGDQIMYDMGGYNEPVYQQPVYQEPAYNEPVYAEPSYMPAAEQPYVEPYQYLPAAEQPYYEPYVAPIEQQYVEPYQYQQPVYNEPAYTPAAEQYVEPYVAPYVEPYVAPYQYTPAVEQYMPAAEQPYVEPYVAPYTPAAEQPYVEPYVEPYVAPYMSPAEQYLPATEQPYVEPYQYLPATEQPYVAPYVEPYVAPQAEQSFASPRYNGEDIYNSAPAETPYIPGFSNYLEASVPPYAAPAEVAAPYVEPYQPTPAAQPMTQEAAPAADAAPFDINSLAGLDFSGLNNLYGMNFASDFGGGAMGGQYEADPNLQYISAPLSNKGNATSQTGGNTFAVRADQPVRLVDHRTNQIVFEGTGFDAARKATELGQGLTDQFGRKANYSIQTADPTGNYSTVAYEKKNKSTLGKIANVAGTVLPLAMIPLTMGASAPLAGLKAAGKIALGAALGGAGAGLKGDNILKGAAMGGLSAAGGSLLGAPLGKVGDIGLRAGTAIGTGLGATAGGLATGQSLKSSLLGGVASGALSYITPDIVKGLGINQAPTTSTSTGGADSSAVYGGPNADIIVNATPSISTPNINLGGFKTPAQKYLDDAANTEVSNPITNTDYASGYDGDIINVTGSVPGAVTGGLNLAGLTADPVANNTNPITDEIVVSGTRPGAVTDSAVTGSVNLGGLTANPTANVSDDIVVTGQRSGAVTDSAVTGGVNLGALTTTAPAVRPEDIVVTGNKTEQPVTGGLTLSPDTVADLDKTSEAEKEGKKDRKLGAEEYLRLLSLVAGLADVGGGKGSAGKYTPGGRGLSSIFSAKLPSASGFGAIGGNRTLRQLGDVDWLTYGTRPELRFFDYANPAPITKPIPNEPRGPSMYAPETDDNTFARGGGAFAAKRGGPSQRTEFAVNGPGTGRSDDIPAVLSDGEYVIDAETVALLGDGSNKAGAKKLDDLRVKVRKHKGQKLAKGRFSANAKKPEAYLSGGRV
jgi:hypothetical protein